MCKWKETLDLTFLIFRRSAKICGVMLRNSQNLAEKAVKLGICQSRFKLSMWIFNLFFPYSSVPRKDWESLVNLVVSPLLEYVNLFYCTFQTVMKLGNVADTLRFGSFTFAQAIHIFVLCLPGQRLLNHNEQVHAAAYVFWYLSFFKENVSLQHSFFFLHFNYKN